MDGADSTDQNFWHPMQLPQPLVHLFDFPIEEILEHLPPASAPEWNMDPLRQKTFAVHRQTRSILFEWLDNDWKPGLPVTVQPFRYTADALCAAVAKAASMIAENYSGTVVKLMLAELAPGGEIPVHFDSVPALLSVHRCHLPIRTSESVKFFIDYQPYCLRPGSVYEFDNTRWHSVLNQSGISRVHLICDIMPSSYMQTA
jgi:hypothetical protein